MTPKKPTPKTKFIHVRIDEETHDQFAQVVLPSTVSDKVRKMIKAYITRNKK